MGLAMVSYDRLHILRSVSTNAVATVFEVRTHAERSVKRPNDR